MFKPRNYCCLLLLTLLACRSAAPTPPLKRPAPGDRVTPELHWSSPWVAGQPSPLFVRIKAEGAAGQPSCLVGEHDVPEDCKPLLTIVYLKAGVEIGRHDQAEMPAFC